MSLPSRIEAIVFASDEPVSIQKLRDLLEGAASADIRQALSELQAHYGERGIRLREVAGGWQFRSASEYASVVQQLWKTRAPKLSRSMLETLAIIAYRQPATRAEIEALRGVRVSSSMVAALQERGWIKVLGRKEVPGRPHLYGTGKAFLVDFGLNTLNDLPDITELMDKDEVETAIEPKETEAVEENETAEA
jgi:segregation and condensation protein B